MVAMFLGRLEFFTIVIGVIKLIDDGPQLLSTGLKSFATTSVGEGDETSQAARPE
jgi:hypothetical protein